MSEIVIEDWWQEVNSGRADELCRMWEQQGADIPAQEARSRTAEAVCAARDGNGTLVAISTARAILVPFLGERMFYFRTFVVPALRRGRLGPRLAFSSRRLLNAEYQRQQRTNQPIGLLLEIENAGLSRLRERAVWERPTVKQSKADNFWNQGKLVYAGPSPRGFDRRIWYFDDARLQRPGQPPRR